MDIEAISLHELQAESISRSEIIQSLWSGYGNIIRYKVEGYCKSSVIVKHIKFPIENQHPRGWNSNLSHQRKIKSYQVESTWYLDWADGCNASCRIPKCLAIIHEGNESLILLEDLDQAGYPIRKNDVSIEEMKICLTWLANFHSIHINKKPANLWQKGTYWHLETRPDELKALTDIKLKNAAKAIDQKLDNCQFQTIVHGDAKLANFCFSLDTTQVAAVDFQYVGGGCGMKDVAYFIGSCLSEVECKKYIPQLLDYYTEALNHSIKRQNLSIDFQALESEWRQLFPIAWADFHRFLKGWSPEHWKINSYSEKITQEVIDNLS